MHKKNYLDIKILNLYIFAFEKGERPDQHENRKFA